MPPRQPINKPWYTQFLPFVWPVLSFVFGFGANYINTQNDIKNLTVAVNKLTDKVEQGGENYGKVSNRVTALETVVFGNYTPYKQNIK